MNQMKNQTNVTKILKRKGKFGWKNPLERTIVSSPYIFLLYELIGSYT